MKNFNQIDFPVGHIFKLEKVEVKDGEESSKEAGESDVCKILSSERLSHLGDGVSNIPKIDNAFYCKTLGMGDHTSGIITSEIQGIYETMEGIMFETTTSVYRLTEFSPSPVFMISDWLRTKISRIKSRFEN